MRWVAVDYLPWWRVISKSRLLGGKLEKKDDSERCLSLEQPEGDCSDGKPIMGM